MADATRMVTGQGVFRLAAVWEAFANRIVGWKCSDRCDTELVLGALAYAVIAQSMGSVGDSYDNALMENFFSALKTELV